MRVLGKKTSRGVNPPPLPQLFSTDFELDIKHSAEMTLCIY